MMCHKGVLATQQGNYIVSLFGAMSELKVQIFVHLNLIILGHEVRFHKGIDFMVGALITCTTGAHTYKQEVACDIHALSCHAWSPVYSPGRHSYQ